VADDVRSPFDDLDPPPPSRLLAVGALVGGLLMVAAVAVVWGALTIAYGAEPFPWIAVVIVTAVPALLLAIGIDMVLRAFRGRSPGYWPIAAVTYILVLVALVTLLKAAETQYAEETARMDAACSEADISVLRSLPRVDGIVVSEPAGDRLGTCTAAVRVKGPYPYLGSLSATLEKAGWTANVDDLTHRLSATRDGVSVVWVVGSSDDQGVTTIEVSVPPSDPTGVPSP